MNNYLESVRTYCQGLEKDGKITPIEITYPAFSISLNSFRKSVLDYVTDRVRSGLLSGDYGNKKFDDNITYENLLLTENRMKQNIYRSEDMGNKAFIDKILTVAINKDNNLSSQEINKNAIQDNCVNQMQYAFYEILHLKDTSIAFERDYQSTYYVLKDKFAATMIMLEENMPKIYKSVKASLAYSPNTDLSADLTDLIKEPTISVIKHIADQDEKFAKERFPKQFNQLMEAKKEIVFSF